MVNFTAVFKNHSSAEKVSETFSDLGYKVNLSKDFSHNYSNKNVAHKLKKAIELYPDGTSIHILGVPFFDALSLLNQIKDLPDLAACEF